MRKYLFPANDSVETFFQTNWMQNLKTCRNFFASNLENCRLQSENVSDIIYFFKNMCFVKKISLAHRVQFWQPHRNIRLRSTKNFCPNFKRVNQLKFLFKTFFPSKWSSGHLKRSSNKPAVRCHQKVRKLFAQGLKVAFQIKLLSNQVFIPKLLLWHVDCKFYVPA